MPKIAIIIGAGPAGLTAAYELLKKTDITPVILEKSGDIGGISKTVNYKGNRMDIGGHRFFSKSDRVMKWWLNILPIQTMDEKTFTLTYRRRSKTIDAEEAFPRVSNADQSDQIMLVRKRLSRIYFLRKFFTYPIQLSLDTLGKLGFLRTVGILISYMRAALFPRKPEKSLEDFFINRFGNKLYLLFFKDYTEKVWGVPCTRISAEWGAQRIKGVSIGKAIAYAVKSLKPPRKTDIDIAQKGTETSLIENFLYPKYGPGQLWEEVARQVETMGGKILMHHDVKEIIAEERRISSIEAINSETGEICTLKGDYFFSTMPVQELIAGMSSKVPANVREVAAGLQYRDFITVGVLLKKMPPPGEKENIKKILPDTWIYIQEKDVKVGRLQIFNNWSPFMVKDPETVWIGMEYFCNKGDDFWGMSDANIQASAILELEKMDLASVEDVLDSTVLRMEKTYPAYFGTYDRFEEIRKFADSFENLFLIGRNGMHKYNNSDHSMLTAMVAVDNILEGVKSKTNIWAINTEQEYHEEKVEKQTHASEPTSKTPLAPAPTLAKLPGQIQGTFADYLFKNRWNKTFLWISGVAIVAQLIIFKYLYPQAGFINGDSYVYIRAAFLNYPINSYPVGYSKFLRLFSVFSESDTALVAFQYLLLQSTALNLIFTVFYFYRPGKLAKIILGIFAVLNPVFLYLSNYVSSDALFISLSLLWLTLLVWTIERPNIRLILVQALILFFAFTVRYNALYYPILTALALLLSPQRIYIKLFGIAASIFVIAAFMWHTSNEFYDLTGIRQFSPFSGWQMANNALYAYRFVDSQDVKPVPARFRKLNAMVRKYFDTTRDVLKHPQEMLLANTWYMWDTYSPLKQYLYKESKTDSATQKLKDWASVGPLYGDYGTYLIRQYPLVFAKYYLWPNTTKYYAPAVEFLEDYNMGRDTVAPIAMQWFGYNSNKVKTAFKNQEVTVLDFYPIFVGVLNAVFLISFLFFGMLKGFSKNSSLRKIILLMGGCWLVNFGFSIFASSIVLRAQLFPVFILFCSAILMLEYIYKLAFIPANKNLESPFGNYLNPSDKPKLA